MEQFSQGNNTVAQELFSFATGNSPNGVLGGLRLRKLRPIVSVSYIQGTFRFLLSVVVFDFLKHESDVNSPSILKLDWSENAK